MTSQDSQNLAEFMLDRVDMGIIVIDRSFRIQLWNKFMATHSGKSSPQVLGQDIFTLFPELPERWLKKKIESVYILKNRAFTSWQQRPYLFRFRHNRPVTGGLDYMYQTCTFTPIKNANGDVEQVGITVQDATDEGIYQKRLEETMFRLEEASKIDTLTQLYNRGHWESCLATEFRRVNRYRTPCSLIMFDLDHFKDINDNEGHLVGDEVLRQVANKLKELLRDTDIAGRYGGEEFGVIATETALDGAFALAERIRLNMEALEISYEGKQVTITISVGIAQLIAGAANYEAVISQADEALYQSKAAGRNRSSCYQSIS